jgi:hypothetical protein
MWVLPLAAAVISVVFAVMLGKQFFERKRPHQLLWMLALLMYAVASFALVLGGQNGWTPGEYKAFWLFGAVLNVPFLAQGELYLLVKNRYVTAALLFLLLFGTGYAVMTVVRAPVDQQFLTEELPSGKDVLGPDSAAYLLARYFSYPAYAVLVAGTLWSAWRMRGNRALRDRFVGTLLIAVGATIVAAGAAFAATGLLVGFSLTLVAGIAAMFWGFLRASRPTASATAPALDPTSG